MAAHLGSHECRSWNIWKDYWRIESKIYLSPKFSCGKRQGAKLYQEVTNPIRNQVKPIRVSFKHHPRTSSLRGWGQKTDNNPSSRITKLDVPYHSNRYLRIESVIEGCGGEIVVSTGPRNRRLQTCKRQATRRNPKLRRTRK